MIQIAISVAVLAWAIYASLLALRNGKRLKSEMANNAKAIKVQCEVNEFILNNVDRKLAKQEAELTNLRKAAQKRGATGQYVKK